MCELGTLVSRTQYCSAPASLGIVPPGGTQAEKRRLPLLSQRHDPDGDSERQDRTAFSSTEPNSSTPSTAPCSACVDCHTDVKSLAHETPPEEGHLRRVPRRRADAYAHSTHAKPRRRPRPRPLVPGLPRRRARIVAPAIRIRPSIMPTFPSPAAGATGKSSSWSRTARARSPSSPTRKACTAAPSRKAREGRRLHRLPRRHKILPANDAKSPIYKFNVPATCGKCHTDVAQHLHAEHSRAGELRAAMSWRPSARTATASTPSRRTAIPTRRSPSRISPGHLRPLPSRGCVFRRSSACPATASTATLTAITAWPRKAARWLRPTAPVATASTTFFLRAIPAPPSTMPISRQPAASATRASRRSSPHPGASRRRRSLQRHRLHRRALGAPASTSS